mmetsp:Transcript_46703/g.105563  ORF Transcript_46703/g.105563 Transcript_46703/m.105563 type:complete len:368 (-) Transcript_46703:256-1359(-)
MVASWIRSCALLLASGAVDAGTLMAKDLVKQFFHGQRHGFYLEMGALDGITQSHSLKFEEDLGWDGVLLEANWKSCESLFEQPRRKTAIKLCASVCDDPSGYLFFERTEDPFTSASLSAMTEEWRKAYHLERGGQKPAELELTPVPCSPLGRHLRIVGVKQIDIFFLDVEGAELGVLKTFDWSIPVRVFVMEVAPENNEGVAKLMKSHGCIWRGESNPAFLLLLGKTISRFKKNAAPARPPRLFSRYMLSDFEAKREWTVHGADQLWVHRDFATPAWKKAAQWRPAPPPPDLKAPDGETISAPPPVVVATTDTPDGDDGFEPQKKRSAENGPTNIELLFYFFLAIVLSNAVTYVLVSRSAKKEKSLP